MARSPQMAHRALTPRLLGALRLAPSDGDVSAPEGTRVRAQEGQKFTSQRPYTAGGLDSETKMSIVGTPRGFSLTQTRVPTLPVTLGKSLGMWNAHFASLLRDGCDTDFTESFV